MSSIDSSKRKLIFLWTYTDWGGAQLYMLTIMKVAAEIWDVVVVLPKATKQDVLDFYEPYGIRTEFLDHHFDPKVETTIFRKLRRQFHRIRAEIGAYRHLQSYDLQNSVLHIEIAPWQSWVFLSLLSLRGANVFTTLNNFSPDSPKWRMLIWRARFFVLSRLPGFRIFASNKDAKASLRKWLTPSYWESVPVAYSPIDPVQIAEVESHGVAVSSLRRHYGVSDNDFVILAVGQFVDRKGRWIFLDAARSVLKQIPEARFIWLMPNPVTAEEDEKIESYGLKDRFKPVLSSDVGTDRVSILGFFRIADVFTLPSFVEGLPIALLEAMALKLPSISTNVYAIPEAIIPDETGILIEAGNAVALADAILRLRFDADLREKLARQGSRFALENFDGQVMASIYLESYRQCFDS